MNRDCLKEIKALGRPFQIGSLYNYNEDTIIKGNYTTFIFIYVIISTIE